MSENRYSPDSGGPEGDASQIYKRLSNMTPDELVDEMADQWDAMDDENFDPQLITVYLNEMSTKESMPSDFNAEVALTAFRKNIPICSNIWNPPQSR
jgi:hypothetical protein